MNLTSVGFVSAEKVENLTILGDSISTGYGLSENDLNYGAYLEKYFNAQVSNFAVNGQTTAELLYELDDSEIISSVEGSELVCISIGGNDFLSIFENAYSEMNGEITISEGEINVSSDFVSKFITDYASAFDPAAAEACENIKKIKERIKEINPDAQIVMQTVYNPFESSDDKANIIMTPLKTFSSVYLSTVNKAIKEVYPDTADIDLKFSEKPYLYTNIDSYDIHPNAIGHMLIAEEIIQVLEEDGDFEVFKQAVYNIPQGVYSEFPEYTANELNLFADGQLRRGTLESTVNKDALSKNIDETEEISQSETEEVIEITEQKPEKKEDKKEESNVRNILSRIFLLMGVLIILAVTVKRHYKKKRMR